MTVSRGKSDANIKIKRVFAGRSVAGREEKIEDAGKKQEMILSRRLMRRGLTLKELSHRRGKIMWDKIEGLFLEKLLFCVGSRLVVKKPVT